ncbi:MAG: dicarboxylate/amino acid:cation symporter [Hyphomonadaceae bacterium]|nr:dicarboxylate/amino acid:cation symporter [Hyphomonadaceae bacterium]
MFASWQAMKLWERVLIALVLGMIVGLAAHYSGFSQITGFITVWIKPFGQAFVNLIKMLIVPLIVVTLVSGVVAMGDPKRLGSLGIRTIALYMGTTLFAVTLGLVFGTIFQPGTGVEFGNVDEGTRSMLASSVSQDMPSVTDRLLAIIPTNPIQAMVEGDIIAVIFFSILIGVGIITVGEKAAPLRNFFHAAEEVVMKITLFVMELAPVGVFALIAWVMSDMGLGILAALGKLSIALYLACVVHIALVYGGLIVRTLLGLPLARFFFGVMDAQGVAYSTASSSATLPVSISCAQENLGVDESVAGSVLPLGATINMDGTSIYLGLIALFAAQALGIDLSLVDYFMIAGTATLTSIGAAGIPSASLFLAFAVLGTFGVSLEQYTLIIAFILPFDRLLDMMRTLTNVTGDLAVASVVAKWEGQLDEEVFRAVPAR